MTRVAAVQMNSGADARANLRQAAGLIRRAADDGAEFVLLPEFFPLMSDDETAKVALRETPGDGPLQNFLAERAAEHGVWLMGGTIPIDCGERGRVYNSCRLYDPQGELRCSYDKMHLFDVTVGDGETHNESDTIAPGKEPVVADTPLGRFGMTVCYDLRFPELYRLLLDLGADIFTAPSAFTYATGKRHWQMLLQARAVENLCFVIAANQTGANTARRRTWGHSMIVHPWGEVLACVEEDDIGVAVAEIDRAEAAALRRSFPAPAHRTIGIAQPSTETKP